MAEPSTQCIDKKLPIQYTHSELLTISQQISQQFSPEILTKRCVTTRHQEMSSQQLREVSQQISTYYTVKLDLNTTRLLLLPVTPNSLYIYWNLADNQANLARQQRLGRQWMLKIFAQSTMNVGKIVEQSIIEIPINQTQSRQQITLPTTQKNSLYSASLGILDAEHLFSPLLTTASFYGYYTQIPPSEPSVSSSKPVDTIASLHYAATNHSARGISS